jgi:glycosyltransferase involved in cell wall biosynthesis
MADRRCSGSPAVRRVIFITQIVDPDHPALGATVAKIRALAGRVDEVVAMALDAVGDSLPANCRVRTFGAGSRVGRGLRFEAVLASELRPRPLAVVAHMAPVYSELAAPLCRPLHIPLLLWFTHWRASWSLRVAEFVSTTVITADRRSFPLPSRKVVVTGHGIDLDEFPCVPPVDHEGLQILSLGRYSPAKGLETVIRAVGSVPDARLRHHGPALTDEERGCKVELQQLVASLGLGHRVELGGPVPRSEVPGLLASADALVNNMRPGAADKVVYEAAASCVPALASSPVFDELLPVSLRFPRDDPAMLADRLRELGAMDRRLLGLELRERVARDHSVGTWARRLLEAVDR